MNTCVDAATFLARSPPVKSESGLYHAIEGSAPALLLREAGDGSTTWLEIEPSDLGRDALMAEVPPAMVSGSLRMPFLAVLPRDGAVAGHRMTSRAFPASRRAPSWAESRPGALDRFPTNFPTKRDDLVGLCSREHE
jgi:hypothetical protein